MAPATEPSKKKAKVEKSPEQEDNGADSKEEEEETKDAPMEDAASPSKKEDEKEETVKVVIEDNDDEEANDDKEGGKDDDDKGTPSETANTPGDKRRFFPRIKHLLTREWEYFLTGVLDAMEQAGAPRAAAASHKVNNPWYKAFDLVYGGVAHDCSMPTGKNRFHKFKDKITELWVAMEQHAPDDHPQKQRAIDQLSEYRKACQQHQGIKQTPTNGKETPSYYGGTLTPSKSPVASGAKGAASASKGAGDAGGKSALGASSTSKRALSFPLGGRWKHLNETEVLKNLPEPLHSLVHLRGMAEELKHTSGDIHMEASITIETRYVKALESYLTSDEEKQEKTGDDLKKVLFERCQMLVALSRQTHGTKESKDIAAAYERTLSEYILELNTGVAV